MLETIFEAAKTFGLILLAILGVIIVVKTMYKKAPPNKAMAVTGPTGTKTYIGQGRFVIPVIQEVSYLTLENIQSDFTSRDEIPTKDAINIMVDAVANVAVSQDPELLKIAVSKFLGYKPAQIREIITPVLEGNIREIISQTTLKELIQGDKKIFAERIIENVTPNLRDMGLELITFNIQTFKDRNSVIENLGLENTVQISKDAAIAKAAAEKEIAIAQAEADMAANEAQVRAEQEIAMRQNELAIKKAELKRIEDTKQAEADAAYEIQQQEQRASIEAKTAEANLVRMEKEIELKEREVTIKERALEAEVKKTAEAKKYAEQQAADADLYKTQKAAEADLFERERQAEAAMIEAEKKAAADLALAQADAAAKKALAEAVQAEGEAKAAAARAQGLAEAEAIRAKAEAEAEGLLKKAEAMKQYGDAAMADMQMEVLKHYFSQMPAMAEAIGKGYQGVDKIVMLGNDSGQLAGNIMNTTTQISEGLAESMGIDLKTLFSGLIGGAIGGNIADKN